MKKIVVLTAEPFGYKPWGIFKDEEQLRKHLIEDWDLEEGFDLDETLENQEMKMCWCEDFTQL